MNVKSAGKAPVLEAVVLAAGRGSRFGGDKLLTPWRDGVLLDGALTAAFAAPVRRVTVETGANGKEVASAARRWAEATGVASRLLIAHSDHWEAGLSASLKAAIGSLAPDVDGAFVFLGDMPRIPIAVLGALADALRSGAAAAVPVHAGTAGHPTLIGAGLFAAIQDLEGDRGARAILDGVGAALARVETGDDGVLFDVDTQQAMTQA